MRRLPNVATPPTAVALFVLVGANVPGPAAIAIVTTDVKLVAVLLRESRAVTTTAGRIAAPATVLVGCWVNASETAGAGVIVNVLLAGTEVSEPAEACRA